MAVTIKDNGTITIPLAMANTTIQIKLGVIRVSGMRGKKVDLVKKHILMEPSIGDNSKMI